VTVDGIELLVSSLRQAVAKPQTRGPLVALLRGDGALDLRVPPDSVLVSPDVFFCAIRSGAQQAGATAVGFVLPVRTLWGDEHVCSILDAEALALVAVADLGDRVVSAGFRCPLHALPDGWVDAHHKLRSLARPLQYVLVDEV
jgi:hypothetical protein